MNLSAAWFWTRLLAIVLMIAGMVAVRPQVADGSESPRILQDDCCAPSPSDQDEDSPRRPCRNCGAVCCTGIVAVVNPPLFAFTVELQSTLKIASVQSDRCAFADPLLDPPRV